MHMIALVSQKGGTGKSRLAIALAIAATQDGHKVSPLEADPQAPCPTDANAALNRSRSWNG